MQLINFIPGYNFTQTSQPTSSLNYQGVGHCSNGMNIYTLEDLVDTLEEVSSYLKLQVLS
ncbi:MAG: serine dehydratase [Sphaerospermopsis sp. SIO1G2]|nr:serine dehydratase [Sphaerospermopsis sp. SIO1G1]NET71035.1 serine dehydratase [Sphaerospermopsis sp. SIO1G2]